MPVQTTPPAARPIAGGQIAVPGGVPSDSAHASPEARTLTYEVWASEAGNSWVELVTEPGAPPIHLDAVTVTALQTAIAVHRPGNPIRTAEIGIGQRGVTVGMRQQWPVATVALAFAGVVALVGLLVVVRRAQRRAQTALAVAQHTAASREAERTRVAREIHDGPVQDLALLARATPDAAVQTRLRDVGAELRALATDLRPPALDALGLAPALADLADRWAASPTPLAVRVTDTLGRRLAPEAELALYRIAQEALTNAATHGRARTAWVFLRGGEGEPASLVVRDDGVGLAPGLVARPQRLVAEGHFGLAGMTERSRALGGRFSAGPGPGGVGTEVSVVLPEASARPRWAHRAPVAQTAPTP